MTKDPYYQFQCSRLNSLFICNYLLQDYFEDYHHIPYALTGERFGDPETIRVEEMHLNFTNFKKSLVVYLYTEQNGTLTLAVPRNTIQSFKERVNITGYDEFTQIPIPSSQDAEKDFTVLIDEESYVSSSSSDTAVVRELPYDGYVKCCDEEGKSYSPDELFGLRIDDYRFLLIEFPKGTDKIEIIGTWVVADYLARGLVLCEDLFCPYNISGPNDESYTIEYRLREHVDEPEGGKIKVSNIYANTSRNSLTIDYSIIAPLGGELVVEARIPSSFMDAFPNAVDEVGNRFAIYRDGERIDQDFRAYIADNSNNQDSRIELYVPESIGDHKIEIVGAKIVPEFGPLSSVITAIGIMAAIVISSRFGSFRIK